MKISIFTMLFAAILQMTLEHIMVRGPKELKDKFPDNRINVSLSNFGRIPYGYNLVGKIHYDPNSIDEEMGCKNITTINIGEDHAIDEAPIVMVHR